MFLGTLGWCYLSDKFHKYMSWKGKKERQLVYSMLGFFSNSINCFLTFLSLARSNKAIKYQTLFEEKIENVKLFFLIRT